MTTLYYFAALDGYWSLVLEIRWKILVLGFTPNMVMGVDLSPIADLLKSEVYQLGSYLNVPASIQEAAPTDGLFGDSRSDESIRG